jgi:hypothetical protein
MGLAFHIFYNRKLLRGRGFLKKDRRGDQKCDGCGNCCRNPNPLPEER